MMEIMILYMEKVFKRTRFKKRQIQNRECMSAGLKFVTLFSKFRNVGVCKDVGMIPEVLMQSYGYLSTIACYDIGEKYPDRDKFFPKLKISFIPKGRSQFLDELRYIKKNGYKIDVLNMYHMTFWHLLCLNFYKIINPNGIAYLKLDLDIPGCIQHEKMSSWKKCVIRLLHRKVDIVTAESRLICNKYYEIFGVKPQYLPNGFYRFSNVDVQNMEKQKIILTVGRLGTEQKATEILLEAFSEIALRYADWKLVCVGSIEETFIPLLNKFKKIHENLKDRIVFLGVIDDKEALSQLYSEAAIFVLSSRWEGCPITVGEAISNGCYLVVTDAVHSFDEYTKCGEFGAKAKIDDVGDLARALSEGIDILEENVKLTYQIQEFSDRFEWECICGTLDKMIKDRVETGLR